jgi:ABC-type branched-subunit amino acid transport system ATPase component/ABC-type branched-subunit amino acid transport system permease subunit
LLIVCAAIAAYPLMAGGHYAINVGTQIGIYLMVAMGLNLLSGYVGQPSIAHGALLGIGAYTAAILMVDHGVDFWLATAAAIVVTACIGAVIALPALRVSSWYFALVTLGIAEVVNAMIVEWDWLTHSFSGIVGIMPPTFFGARFSQRGLFWLVGAVNLLVFVGTASLVRSPYGKAMIAARDNPLAATATGIGLVRTKVIAFILSAAITGLAGAIYAVQKTVITPDDFTADLSIFFLVVVVLGGSGRLWGPVLGTLVFFVVPEFMTSLASWRMLIYGGVLLAIILFAPRGLASALEPFGRRALDFLRWPDRDLPSPDPEAAKADTAINGVRISVANAAKSFEGVKAVSGVNMDVSSGQIHAVVGPNGSGKTTLLNLISGFYAIDSGAISIGGEDTTHRPAVAIARLGVGRTFQTPKLLPELSVLDNLLLGGSSAHGRGVGGAASSRRSSGRKRRSRLQKAMNLLAFVGLADRAAEPAGKLPHGLQRLLEIARALMGDPGVLLLDEPAAGLALSEVQRLSELLRTVNGRGVTIMLVEHHLDLVAEICNSVTVLDRGQVIFEGKPADVFVNEQVRQVYMGRQPVRLDAKT